MSCIQSNPTRIRTSRCGPKAGIGPPSAFMRSGSTPFIPTFLEVLGQEKV